MNTPARHKSIYADMDMKERQRKVMDALRPARGGHDGGSGDATDSHAPLLPEASELFELLGISPDMLEEVGAMAGLDDPAGYIESLARDYTREYILDQCDPGKPTDDFGEILLRLKKDELVHIARTLKTIPSPSNKNKRKLAQSIVSFVRTHADSISDPLAAAGPAYIADVERLWRAGGRISVPDSEVTSSGIMPPSFPFVYLFHDGTNFVNVMPKEVRTTLNSTNWDELHTHAQKHEDASKWLDALVGIRGLVRFDEAYEEMCAALGEPIDRQLLEAGLVANTDSETTTCEAVVLTEEGRVTDAPEEGVLWVAYGPLVDRLRSSGSTDMDRLSRLACLQQEYKPRPLPEEVRSLDDAIAWAAALPSGRALISYLDERVPEFASDLLFSWRLLSTAIKCVQMDGSDMTSFFEQLYEDDPDLDEQEVRELCPLLGALSYDAPRWDLNGWSEAESLACRFALDGPAIRWDDGPDEDFDDEDGTDDGLDEDFDDEDEDDYDGEWEEVDPDDIVRENECYLDEFEEWLKASGLSSKTISGHVSNVDFFLNSYAAYYEGVGMQEAVSYVSGFLGNWFIRKALWSTPSTIRQSAASFKKFYKCMAEKGHVTDADAAHVVSVIKNGLDEWCETCEAYNDPDADIPFDPFDLFL